MQVFAYADYLNAVLGSLPGVDPSDPALQSALRNLAGGLGEPEKKDEGKGDDGKQGQ